MIFMHCVCARQVRIAAAFKGLGFAAVYLTVYNYQKGILDGGGGGGSAIAMMFSFNGLCLLYKVRRGGRGTGDHYTLFILTTKSISARRLRGINYILPEQLKA